ncbi:OLC1v1032506C1 [Oldenlandia corymbosa var. corymbosa]|uniref:OLC1v1032506C1 n=1 Tax=Oldenlandia corymbosa var. corymbosa TaxID=529605 RepID=A0AAV1CLX1_OLDCO|nr:OLC1v1032506C1 [Oldenlandia corymbosa var. corymbosa]
MDALLETSGLSAFDNIPKNEQKRGRNIDGEEEVDASEFDNPESEAWVKKNRKSPWAAGKREVVREELTEEQKKYTAEKYAKKNKGTEAAENEDAGVVDKNIFHGKEERDYQARSWIAPPKDAKASNDHCYALKTLVRTWRGHTKGVSAIRFFPGQGHLIPSAGMDSEVKIWDVYNSGECMRTYTGHSKAVRDIWFTNNGTKFLTASYDKNIKYWDTETGQ